jgi:HKD family nuclease
MNLLVQPFSDVRLGRYLQEHLADSKWTEFRAAIAFVKRSGTQHIRKPLREFGGRGKVRLTVGVDLQGTSAEGLLDLLTCLPDGAVWVYRNEGPSTFHPKIYLFRNERHADLVIGSGNLTGGGLFTNYEVFLATSLDLSNNEDAAFVQQVEAALDTWSTEAEATCHRLTHDILKQLVAEGLVLPEAELAAQRAATVGRRGTLPGSTQGDIARLFRSVPVPRAPVVIDDTLGDAEGEHRQVSERVSPALSPLVAQNTSSLGSFVMTLQNTDVGFGQTTKGTSQRSPEVFIPLAALDQNGAFWTFPGQFKRDKGWDSSHPKDRRNGLGKLDRMGVPMRIGVVRLVNMFFNPRKKDFRLRNEVLRSSGNVGDIILVQRVEPSNGFEYDIRVAPKGSALFKQLEPLCNTPVPNSLKTFGYF